MPAARRDPMTAVAKDGLKALLAPSLRKAVAVGYVVQLLLLLALAGVTCQLMMPIGADARRVARDSANAEVATAVSLRVDDTRALATQYALSSTLPDQAAARQSLARLDQAITATGAGGGHDEFGLAALASAYRGSVNSTFAAVAARRAGTAQLQTAGTEIRTVISAVALALEAETDPELIRSDLRLAQNFQAGDVAAMRFLASRLPADADMAVNGLKAVPAAIAELIRQVGENRRIRRFSAALEPPLAAYGEALRGVLAADEQLRIAATTRDAVSKVLLAATAAERDRAAGSQRGAVASMLGSVGAVRWLLLVASLAMAGIGLTLAVLIGRSIIHPIRQITRATERVAEGDLFLDFRDLPGLSRRDEIGQMARALTVFLRNNLTEVAGFLETAFRCR